MGSWPAVSGATQLTSSVLCRLPAVTVGASSLAGGSSTSVTVTTMV